MRQNRFTTRFTPNAPRAPVAPASNHHDAVDHGVDHRVPVAPRRPQNILLLD